MTTVTQERQSRRTKDEILTLVDKAEKLISNGTPKTQAAKEVGLSYPVLQKHLGEGVKSSKTDDKVDIAYKRFREALENQIRQEILRRI